MAVNNIGRFQLEIALLFLLYMVYPGKKKPFILQACLLHIPCDGSAQFSYWFGPIP